MTNKVALYTTVPSSTTVGYTVDGVSYPRQVWYTPNCFPSTTTGSAQLQLSYIDKQGDDVKINVVETIDGFKGQIKMNVDGQELIVWEEKHAHTAADYAYEAEDGKTGSNGAKEAQDAAKQAAQAHAGYVLKGIFNKPRSNK